MRGLCLRACGSKLNESDNAKYIANVNVVVDPTSSSNIFPGVIDDVTSAPPSAPRGALIATTIPSVERLLAGAAVVRPPGNDIKRGSLACDLVVLICAVFKFFV